jgi:hypothetical protein
VTNIDGLEAPTQPPCIDIVLGQNNLQSTRPNKGRGPSGFARDTLGGNGIPLLDFEGNLYVQDNASLGVDGGDTRILRWDAGTVPSSPPSTVFYLLPDSVYGFGGPYNFTFPGSAVNEIAPAPRAPAFDTHGRMVLGGPDPYTGRRFPLVFLNKDQDYEPQLSLGDYVSFPSVSYMDPEGNLYLGDFDWNRVLVYKAPFAQFAAAPQYTPPPLCTVLGAGQTAWRNASVIAAHINDGKYGNDALQITGRFTMATGGFTIDPIANGAQIEVRSATGIPRVRVVLPGGTYKRPGPGWAKNSEGFKYTFTNLRPTGTDGIHSMTVTDRGSGSVSIVIRANRSAFPLLPTDGPLTLTVVLGGSASGAAGECGQATLQRCTSNRARTGLTCRY